MSLEPKILASAMKSGLLILPFVLALGGCWAVGDLRENWEIHHGMPFQTRVSNGSITALTPVDGLLLENKGKKLVLRQAASGTRYFTASPATPSRCSVM